MNNHKKIYRYYNPKHPYLKTLYLPKNPHIDQIKKYALRFLVILLFFVAEGLFMWAFAESKISHSPLKSEIISGLRPADSRIDNDVLPPIASGNYEMYLVISKLFINAPIEPVGLNSEKDMADPSSNQKIAWYKDGPRPGSVGNSVLTGHYGSPGEIGIFKTLNQLNVGDLVEVRFKNGSNYKYRVKKTERYKTEVIPLKELFGKTEARNLNLVTCAGNWDNQAKTYSERLIVYSELIQ